MFPCVNKLTHFDGAMKVGTIQKKLSYYLISVVIFEGNGHIGGHTKTKKVFYKVA